MMLNSKITEFPSLSLLGDDPHDQPKEPTDMTDFLTVEIEAAILAAGAAVGAAKLVAKPKRASLLSATMEAVEGGQMPPRLAFPRKSSSQKVVDAIYAAMEINDREAVASADTSGVRYDSKVSRAYQVACLAFMDRPISLPKPLPPKDGVVAKPVTVKAPAKPKPSKKEAA